jgi:hypothetical protein
MKLTEKTINLRPCSIEVIEKIQNYAQISFDEAVNELILFHFPMTMEIEMSDLEQIDIKKLHEL